MNSHSSDSNLRSPTERPTKLLRNGLDLGICGIVFGVAAAIVPITFTLISMVASNWLSLGTLQNVVTWMTWLDGVSLLLNAAAAVLLLFVARQLKCLGVIVTYSTMILLGLLLQASMSFARMPADVHSVLSVLNLFLIPFLFLVILRKASIFAESRNGEASANGVLRLLLISAICLLLGRSGLFTLTNFLDNLPPELIYLAVALYAAAIGLSLIIVVRSIITTRAIARALIEPQILGAATEPTIDTALSSFRPLWRVGGIVPLSLLLLVIAVACEVGRQWTANYRRQQFMALFQAQSEQEEQFRVFMTNQQIWELVRQPSTEPQVGDQELEAMISVCSTNPEGAFLNTLGVVQFRLGHYADAIETLEKSRSKNRDDLGDHPSDLAFLAMSHKQLGNEEAAGKYQLQFDQQLQHEKYAKDPECTSFASEMQACFQP